MYKLYDKQQQNITQKIKEKTKNLTKIIKAENRTQFVHFLKNGFPTNCRYYFLTICLKILGDELTWSKNHSCIYHLKKYSYLRILIQINHLKI